MNVKPDIWQEQFLKNDKKIIVIAGPTASGKSDVANELSYRINAEVISADSMQIYRGMDIGTGKIPKSQQKVKHWGIDIINPNEAYSAALFQEYSRKCFDDISSRDKRSVLCGGTGFYIRAAIDDYQFPKGKQINNSVREKYKKYLDTHNAHELWELLNKLDPDSAKIIHENNTVRVIRALELNEEGKSYAKQYENLTNIKQKYDAVFFGLRVDPEILRKRIENRVDSMVNGGLIDEVKDLLSKGYRNSLTAANAIGYKEIVRYLDGQISQDEAIDKIKTATKQYAKRQRTWFNKDKRINWIEYNNVCVDDAIEKIILCCDKDR